MIPFLADPDVVLYDGDALEILRELEDGSAAGVVTSPPYLDARPEYPSPTLPEFGAIFRELHRVSTGPMAWNVGRIWRDRGEVLWWVDLIDEARRAGWQHRDTRVWLKPNANPIRGETFTDSHEYVLVFAHPGDELNTDALRVEYLPGSVARLRRRHISHIGTKADRTSSAGERHEPNANGARPASYTVQYVGGEKGNAHPAPMPLGLAVELVLLTTWPGQTVLDPFAGSGTTLVAARRAGRPALGIELDIGYCALAADRLAQQSLLAETCAP